ncbi:MAG TPA: glycosyltransferase, partial [Methanosarcinales archaeon]|nr:glycosyltransferase [Methanosarcinales archaeon]
MLCRYRKKGTKQYTFGHQVYKFTNKWSDVNNIRLFKALQSYPDVFDTVCFFDLKPFLSFANQIIFKKNLIFTCSKSVAEKLSNIPYVKKQAHKPETGEFVFKALKYSSEDLTAYENTDGAINILAHRDLGGIGDIIMTTPVIEEAVKKYPNYNITYACPEQFLPLLKNNPFITKLRSINSDVTQEDWDAIIDLTSDCIKHEVKHQPDVKLNRVEIFAKKCGIPIENIASPKIFLSEKEILQAKEELKDYGLKIGLVLKSNAPVRNWPYFKELRSLLSKQYPNATFLEFCLEKPSDWHSIKKSYPVFGRSLRTVCGLINECDVVISPDTGLAHIASAFKVPTVWLFTHIDGKIRTKNYDNVEVCQNIPEDCPSKGVPCWYNVLCDKERTENSFNPPCSIALEPVSALEKIRAILSKPNVSYCVVFKDNEEITNECINRILKYKKYNDELILIDDGSEKKLFNYLKENESITIIRNSKNKGCVIARNQAMKRAKGEYLFILDNDQYISGISTHKMMCTEGDIIGVEGWSMGVGDWVFENYNEVGNKFDVNGLFVKKEIAKEIFVENKSLVKKVYTKKTSIIIPVWNNLKLTKECIDSIKKFTKIPYQLVIIDNGSALNVLTWLGQNLSDDDIIIRNSINAGFTRGCNQGIKLSNGHYVLLLNNDTVIQSYSWLTDLIDNLKYADVVGATCAKVIVDNNAKTFCYAGNGNENDKWSYIEGWCIFAERKLFNELEGFDEQFNPAYSEDADFSFRVKKIGKTILKVPVSIYHIGQQSHEMLNKEQPEQSMISNRLLYNKWINGDVKNILVKRKGAFGDVVFTTPIIKALKKKFPNSKIFYKTDCPNALQFNPNIFEFLKESSLHIFDKVFTLEYEKAPQENCIDVMASQAGVELNNNKMDFYLKPLKKKLKIKQPYIVLHTGRVWESRQWPIDRFRKVAQYILSKGVSVIEIGNNATETIFPDNNKVKLYDKWINKDWNKVGHLIKESAFFFGVDSGPSVVAKALQTPAVIIYGCVNPETRFADSEEYPLYIDSLECSGCRNETTATFVKCKQDKVHCLDMITVDMAIS